MLSLLVLLFAELLKFAVAWDSQRQAKLSAPRLDFAQEDVHLSGIELRRVARFPGGFFGTGDEIGVGDFLAAEVCLFEVALDPIRGCVSASGFNQVFADFRVPHMAKRILTKATLLSPWL